MSSNDGDSPYETELTLDTTLDLLSQQERRDIFRYFITNDDQCASLDDIIQHLVQAKTDRGGDVPSDDRLRLSVRHTHLPKLADSGIIDFDKRSQMLRYHPDPRIEKWLEIIDEEYEETVGR